MARKLIVVQLLFFLLNVTQAVVKVYVDEEYILDQGVVRYYEFNITEEHINPDCSDSSPNVLLINGQMPGPAIIADQGDIVRVLIRNQIKTKKGKSQAVAVHFHGIRQYGSNHADGVPFITQLPIHPGEEYVHEFRVVNQAGTYFYHAHIGLQEETIFGPFIIYESKDARPENLTPEEEVTMEGPPRKLIAGPFQYDYERTIVLSEWWHETRLGMENWIMGPNFTSIPEAESILINGRTLFNPKEISVPQCEGYEILSVQPNKVYRLRVIGATAFRTLLFGIANHRMTIIEVDGELVKPYTVSELEVTPGQRFSVLIYTEEDPDNYVIEVVRNWSEDVPNKTNGLAVLHYHTRSPDSDEPFFLRKPVILESPSQRVRFKGIDKPNWIWSDLEPYYGVDPVVNRPASRTIKLRTVEARRENGLSRFYVNGVAFMEHSNNQTPILYDLLSKRRRLPNVFSRYPTGFDPHLGTYPLAHYEIVDIIIQSTHYPGQPCRSHPWHTHGHSHWEIANGIGEYDEKRDGDIRNIPNPIQKDVTLIYPGIDKMLYAEQTDDNEAVGCGWSKIRIIADNPGIWAVHCHNTFHMLLGMMVVLEEAPELITNNSFIDFQNYQF
ncbi:hypothetical protein G6F37_005047 [Rhizopus arrhizus]|nr:hypothetical protein G6F38_005198 [Rhizopus arrhizus]KAG1159276.1 hypothetical protein G6F37_005047 [Rhizopus arrhizus]